MNAHAVLAPSSAAQWVACPGSVLMQQKYPDDTTSEPAIEGTRAHGVAAHWLTHGEPPEGVPDEMIDAVGVYVDDVKRVGGIRRIEVRVDARSIHPQCWGTSDTISRVGRDLYVWDYKHGFGLVEVWMNWQLIAYASGVAEPGDTVHLRIVQPRAYHSGGAVRQWVVTYDQLTAYVTELKDAAGVALGEDPHLTPGKHCRYCSARHACPSARRLVLDAIDYVTAATDEPLPDLSIGDEIRTLRAAADLLSYRLNGLESDATTRLASGRTLPGLEVRHGSGRLEWSRPAADVLAMGQVLGVDLATPVTPRAAIKSGIPEAVVMQYVSRKTGAARVYTDSNEKAKRIFSCPQK